MNIQSLSDYNEYSQSNISDAKQRIMMILPILYALFFAIDATNDEPARTKLYTLNNILKYLNKFAKDDYGRRLLRLLEHLAAAQTDYKLLYCKKLYSILIALPYAVKKYECGFSTMNDIKSDVRNRIGNSLIDLMLISMYGDEHEFDYEILGEYVAENIWHYKKAWAALNF